MHCVKKYVQICGSCCTSEAKLTNRSQSGHNNGGNNLGVETLGIFFCFLFQFCETSSPKTTFSSLVMLLTMEDSRRRLEDADDSPVPENQRDSSLLTHHHLVRHPSSAASPQRTVSLAHHGRSGMVSRGRPGLRGFSPVALVMCGPLRKHTRTHKSRRIPTRFRGLVQKRARNKAVRHKNKTKHGYY